MKFTTKTITFAAGNVKPRDYTIDATGIALFCVSSEYSFEVSIDDGPRLPFGVARTIRPTNDDGTPKTFSKIRIFDSSTLGYTITLIIGDLDYDDKRVQLFGQQYIRSETAARIVGAPYVWADGGGGYMQINAASRAHRVNIRNKDTVNSLCISYGDALPADIAAGFELLPGENVDWDISPCDNWGPGSTGPLFVRGTAGQAFVVTWHYYRVNAPS